MREFVKSTVSLPWALSLFGVEQLTNLLMPQNSGKATAAFDYSGPLTEAVLLGPVATRFPQTKLEWNSAAVRFSNSTEAGMYLRRSYRAGWSVKGLG